MTEKLRLLLAVVLLLITAYVGYDMYHLSLADHLWGYRPLVLLLSAWLGTSLLFAYFVYRADVHWRWFSWSCLSAVLLGVGFPDILPLPVLMFIGFVPLIRVEQEIRKIAGNTGRSLFFYAYNTFVLWNIISTYWVANAALEAGLFAILVNSLLMCIPFLFFHYTQKRMPNLGYFSLIVYWITFEYIHLNWDLSWPWLMLGNSFAEFPAVVQWYEYTGAFGGTLWIWLANILIFSIWQKPSKRSRWWQLAFLLLIPAAFSLFRYYNYEEKGKPIQVAIVQPNYEPHHVKFSIPENMQLQHFIQLSTEVVDENTDYLVFPESSFGYVETHAIESYPAIRGLKSFLQRYPDLKIVAGMNAYTEFLPHEPSTPNTRFLIRPTGDTIRREILNIAVQLEKEQEQIPVYKKSKLVPGPEIFPYQEILAPFKGIVDKLGGTTAGIGTQPERGVFTSESGAIAPVICYESVYGEYFTGYIKKGANAAFVVTNDGWWDNTAGHRQHLYFASLRAIETRRPVAQSANTGISAFINQRGDIIKPTRYDEIASIQHTLKFNDEITFYVIWGDVIARVSVFAAVVLLLNLFVKSWQIPKRN